MYTLDYQSIVLILSKMWTDHLNYIKNEFIFCKLIDTNEIKLISKNSKHYKGINLYLERVKLPRIKEFEYGKIYIEPSNKIGAYLGSNSKYNYFHTLSKSALTQLKIEKQIKAFVEKCEGSNTHFKFLNVFKGRENYIEVVKDLSFESLNQNVAAYHKANKKYKNKYVTFEKFCVLINNLECFE